MAGRIAIFASGSGTNAEAIIRHARENGKYEVPVVVTNNPGAGVISRAQKLDTPVVVLSKTFLSSHQIVDLLERWNIEFIVLAGYLKLVPVELIRHFPGRIINIHPALLPSYGGKGMYGAKVHQAVIQSGDRESGITIHEVNEKYDEGRILFQASCVVDAEDTADSLAGKIHELEHQHYPKFLEKWISGE